MAPVAGDFEVARLGEARIRAPLATSYVDDAERLLLASTVSEVRRSVDAGEALRSFEIAGPRERVFFDPRALRCGMSPAAGSVPG